MKIFKHYFTLFLGVFMSVSVHAQTIDFSPKEIYFDSTIAITVTGRNVLFTDTSVNVFFHNMYLEANGNYQGVSITDIEVVNDTVLKANLRIQAHVRTTLRCIVTYQAQRIFSNSIVKFVSPYINFSTSKYLSYRERLYNMDIYCANFTLDNDTFKSLSFYKEGIVLDGIQVDTFGVYPIPQVKIYAYTGVYFPDTIKPGTYMVKLSTANTPSAMGVLELPFPNVEQVTPGSVVKNDTVSIHFTSINAMYLHGAKTPFLVKANTADTIFAISYEVIDNRSITAKFYITGFPGTYYPKLYDSINGYNISSQPIDVYGPSIISLNTDTLQRNSSVKATLTAVNSHFKSGENIIVFYKDGYRCDGIKATVDSVVNETTLYVTLNVHRLAPSGEYAVSIENARDGLFQGTFNVKVRGATHVLVSPGLLIGNKSNKVVIYGGGTPNPYGIIAFTNNPTIELGLKFYKDSIAADSFHVISDTLIEAYFSLPVSLPVMNGHLYFIDSVNGSLTSESIVSLREPNITSTFPQEVIPGDTTRILLIGDGNIFDLAENIHFARAGNDPENGMIIIDSTEKVSSDSMWVYVRVSLAAAGSYYPLFTINGLAKMPLGFINTAFPTLIASETTKQFGRINVKRLSFGTTNVQHLSVKNIRFVNKSSQLLGTISVDSFYREIDSLHVIAHVSDSFLSNIDFDIEVTWSNNTSTKEEMRMLPPQLRFIPLKKVSADTTAVLYYYGNDPGVQGMQVMFYKNANYSNDFRVDSFSFSRDTLRTYIYIYPEAGGFSYTIHLSKPFDGVFENTGVITVEKHTGLNERFEHKVAINPNPVAADGILNINVPGTISRAILFSVEGRKWNIANNRTGKGIYAINLSELKLSPGVYILCLYDSEGELHIEKLLLQ